MKDFLKFLGMLCFAIVWLGVPVFIIVALIHFVLKYW